MLASAGFWLPCTGLSVARHDTVMIASLTALGNHRSPASKLRLRVCQRLLEAIFSPLLTLGRRACVSFSRPRHQVCAIAVILGLTPSLTLALKFLYRSLQVGSRYNPRLSIIDNIQLPPTLLSRFDLIYLVLDKADEASDRKLARHLVAMYYATPPANAQVMPLNRRLATCVVAQVDGSVAKLAAAMQDAAKCSQLLSGSPFV